MRAARALRQERCRASPVAAKRPRQSNSPHFNERSIDTITEPMAAISIRPNHSALNSKRAEAEQRCSRVRQLPRHPLSLHSLGSTQEVKPLKQGIPSVTSVATVEVPAVALSSAIAGSYDAQPQNRDGKRSSATATNASPLPPREMLPYATAPSPQGCKGDHPRLLLRRNENANSNSSAALGLCGLANLGNTCFMNSCLQCLSNCPPLLQYFLSGQHQQDINRKAGLAKGALALAFGRLMQCLWSESTPAFASTRPTEVKRLIGQFASRFNGYEQQDSQEFLRFMLDALHEDLNRVPTKLPYEEIKDVVGESEDEQAIRWWRHYEMRNDSAVKDLFCGQLRSRVVCRQCSHVSTAFDPFWDLSVPIPSATSKLGHTNCTNRKCSAEECLRAFTSEETLVGDESYYCPKCNTHRESTKRISIQRCPTVLVIHVKRFSRGSGARRTKLTTPISFPIELLDVGPFCSTSAKTLGSTAYSLIGVVNHMGGLGSGHYTAAALNSADNSWYLFNDANVSPLDLNSLDGSSAYVLCV